VTLSVGPAITTQPTNQTVAQGSAATFSVVATGTPTLTYQWQYFNTNSHWVAFGAGTGTTTASMTTNTTTAAYNGLSLRVVVTDGNGVSTISNAVTLTVNSPPVIGTQPTSSQTVADGTQVTLTVAATGTPTLTYQWSVSENSGSYTVIGAGNAVALGVTNYTTNSIGFNTTGDTGNTFVFKVTVTDGNGLTATSNTATVKVATPPVINTQPAVSQTTPKGNAVVLSVSATGTSPLSYQWQYSINGGSYSTIDTSSAGTYGFGNWATSSMIFYASSPYVSAPSTFQFKAVVTDGNGLTTTSNAATVNVTVPSP